MLITIREDDEKPVYRQVIDQVRDSIAGGQLKPGEKLPSVRELARFLDINVNTVQKSYQGLKRMGLIVTRPARGAIVSPKAPEILGSEEQEEVLRGVLSRAMSEAHRLGFNKNQVIALLKKLDFD